MLAAEYLEQHGAARYTEAMFQISRDPEAERAAAQARDDKFWAGRRAIEAGLMEPGDDVTEVMA